MKRRKFLVATLASIFSTAALADEKKANSDVENNQKDKNKNKNKDSNDISNTTNISKPKTNTKTTNKPAVGSARNSVIDHPPKGTSADPKHLPPIAAPKAPTQWKNYKVKFSIKTNKELNNIWQPLPMIHTVQNNLYQKLLSMETAGNFTKQNILHQYENNYHILNANYEKVDNDKELNLQLVIQTADRKTDFSKRNIAPEREDILKYYLQDSELIPNDVIARNLATKIVNRIKDPIAQARAIFDWIIENSTYEMQNLTDNQRGNVRQQLQNSSSSQTHFRGRSAELNGIFVSLCRSIGIPARNVCGLRIGKSNLLPCLGLENEIATDFQHIRAEFYSPGYGWIPIDVSDVKRAESFNTPETELKMLKTLLFGFWEMNWFAFGFGNEVILDNNTNNNNFSNDFSNKFSNRKISFFDKTIGENSNAQWIYFDNNEIKVEATQ